jgi:hypothetical protein
LVLLRSGSAEGILDWATVFTLCIETLSRFVPGKKLQLQGHIVEVAPLRHDRIGTIPVRFGVTPEITLR